MADKQFRLESYYIDKTTSHNTNNSKIDLSTTSQKNDFLNLCTDVKNFFDEEWKLENGMNNKEATDKLLIIQKRAIIGYEKDVNYFRSKINDYLRNKNINCWCPKWYDDLASAIFHENWGFAGIQKWKTMKSQSAKIIGERIYFLIDGKMVLQEQTISKDRLNQLINALMLKDPLIRIKDGTAEVFTLDGIRIKIYTEFGYSYDGIALEPALAFRNFVMEELNFEGQAKMGTIPHESIPMFKAFASIGYNISSVGAVSSGKSTWINTWSKYEDPTLEGIKVQTDPEFKSGKNSPIIDIVADSERIEHLSKDLVRGDADYIDVLEVRDGKAAKLALKAMSKGTRRSKMTFHTTKALDFLYDFADEIVSEYGGDIYSTIVKAANCFHFIFEFCKLRDKSKKRLKAIYEVRFNHETFDISLHQILKYNFPTDSWTFKCDIGEDKEEIAWEQNIDAYNIFYEELKKLEKTNPIQGTNVFMPPYIVLRSKNND